MNCIVQVLFGSRKSLIRVKTMCGSWVLMVKIIYMAYIILDYALTSTI